jgi:hypothetical protein
MNDTLVANLPQGSDNTATIALPRGRIFLSVPKADKSGHAFILSFRSSALVQRFFQIQRTNRPHLAASM